MKTSHQEIEVRSVSLSSSCGRSKKVSRVKTNIVYSMNHVSAVIFVSSNAIEGGSMKASSALDEIPIKEH